VLARKLNGLRNRGGIQCWILRRFRGGWERRSGHSGNRFLSRHYLCMDMLLRRGDSDGSYEKSNNARCFWLARNSAENRLSETVHLLSRLDDFHLHPLRMIVLRLSRALGAKKRA